MNITNNPYVIWCVAVLIVVIGALWMMPIREDYDSVFSGATTSPSDILEELSENTEKAKASPQPSAPTPKPTTAPTGATFKDIKSGTYVIAGKSVTLINGSKVTTGAAGEQILTTFFGNEAVGDLNKDSIPDTGFIITQSTGGSGTFYYAVAAIKTINGWRATNSVYLGDRIAPQTSSISAGELIVNYADRAAGQPMTAKPTMGVSAYFTYKNGSLVGR